MCGKWPNAGGNTGSPACPDIMSPGGAFIFDAGYYAKYWKRKNRQGYQDYVAGGAQAATGFCIAWDSMWALKGQSRDKGMFLFKRLSCDGQGESRQCKVFKMAQCFRCTDQKYMYQVPTKVNFRGNLKDVPAKRVVFTDQIQKDGAWIKTSYNDKLMERRNFARCAI